MDGHKKIAHPFHSEFDISEMENSGQNREYCLLFRGFEINDVQRAIQPLKFLCVVPEGILEVPSSLVEVVITSSRPQTVLSSFSLRHTRQHLVENVVVTLSSCLGERTKKYHDLKIEQFFQNLHKLRARRLKAGLVEVFILRKWRKELDLVSCESMHDSALACTVISIRYQLFERKVGKGMGVFFRKDILNDFYHILTSIHYFQVKKQWWQKSY